MKKGTLLFLAFLAIGAGFVPWQVTSPIRRLCLWVQGENGWEVSVSNARWIPWQDLQLTDLKLRTPQGGHVHVTRVGIALQPGALFLGTLATKWRIAEVRVDPASWNIRQPLAKEILSAGPVTQKGSALLQAHWGRLSLTSLALQGPMLRLQAKGWLTDQHRIHFSMEGMLARVILEEMNLLGAENSASHPWEPFTLDLRGALDHPDLSFASKFFTLSLKTHGEKTL